MFVSGSSQYGSGKTKNKENKQTTMNIKTLIAAIASGVCLCGIAATFDEAKALAATPIDQVTQANVESVINACVTTTNISKIVECRNRELISFEGVAAKISGKPEFAQLLFDNADKSKDTALQEKCFEANYKLFKATEKPDANLKAAAYRSFLKFPTVCTPENRKAVAKELIGLGRTVDAIRVAYGELPGSVFNGMPTEKFKEYAGYSEFCAEVSEQFAAAWLAAEPTVRANGRLASPWDDGADLICYYTAVDKTRLASFAPKAAKYAKDGIILLTHCNNAVGEACRKAFITSAFASDANKVIVAKITDGYAKNKDATKSIYPTLTDIALKVKTAVYLNDADKIIDALKTVNDKLDAETINSVIAPLNAVDAGYRTADLRLALMNVNKKYTLKLYEDRDTWEPILSKIRAMIDTL